MFKNIRKDIYSEELEYLYLSLVANKIRVGIVGAGRGGTIKAKSFLEKGCYVEVLSKEFSEFFDMVKSENLVTKTIDYNKEFIMDKHIIIIAVDDDKLIEEIKEDCQKEYKILINATNFKDGMAVVPVHRETKNISVGISTKVGNPKGAIMVANEVLKTINRYDDFIAFSSKLRNNAKELKSYKREIIGFIGTEDFLYMYSKHKDKEVLKMFFDYEIVQFLYKEK